MYLSGLWTLVLALIFLILLVTQPIGAIILLILIAAQAFTTYVYFLGWETNWNKDTQSLKQMIQYMPFVIGLSVCLFLFWTVVWIIGSQTLVQTAFPANAETSLNELKNLSAIIAFFMILFSGLVILFPPIYVYLRSKSLQELHDKRATLTHDH
jgi:hypothetical protein